MTYPNNFLGYLDSILPAQLSGPYASKFYGLQWSFGGDLWAECLARIVRFSWLRDPGSPDDVLPHLAPERMLPKYSRESTSEWRARLADAWNIYASAGSSACIAEQLTAAKFDGGHVFKDDTQPGPNGEPAPHWSQFWLKLPAGSHYTEFGTGMSDADMTDLRFIAFHFSDVRYVPRGVIAETQAEALSDGFGEAGFGDAGFGDDGTQSVTFSF